MKISANQFLAAVGPQRSHELCSAMRAILSFAAMDSADYHFDLTTLAKLGEILKKRTTENRKLLSEEYAKFKLEIFGEQKEKTKRYLAVCRSIEESEEALDLLYEINGHPIPADRLLLSQHQLQMAAMVFSHENT